MKHTATLGSGLSKENPQEAGSYPYPILITREDQDSDLVYSMVKALHTEYPNYKDALPAMEGWSLENQTFKWAVPYHEAAVKYWKEVGVWTADIDAHNEKLIERQNVLAAAWATMASMDVADDKYQDKWMEVRAAALKAKGMTP
ncbi:MAG: hypothetical protein JKY04_08335 [Sneathiella sp.]|nr:hypothetical protein [Sneathiella sp.]